MDTSAFVAILFEEVEREPFRSLLEIRHAVMSAGNVIELMRVTMWRKPRLVTDAQALLHSLGISVASVDEAQVAHAADGQARFGTGRGKAPAVLKFGDLLAYALARQLDAPLLFKGNDFRRTDFRVAL